MAIAPPAQPMPGLPPLGAGWPAVPGLHATLCACARTAPLQRLRPALARKPVARTTATALRCLPAPAAAMAALPCVGGLRLPLGRPHCTLEAAATPRAGRPPGALAAVQPAPGPGPATGRCAAAPAPIAPAPARARLQPGSAADAALGAPFCAAPPGRAACTHRPAAAPPAPAHPTHAGAQCAPAQSAGCLHRAQRGRSGRAAPAGGGRCHHHRRHLARRLHRAASSGRAAHQRAGRGAHALELLIKELLALAEPIHPQKLARYVTGSSRQCASMLPGKSKNLGCLRNSKTRYRWNLSACAWEVRSSLRVTKNGLSLAKLVVLTSIHCSLPARSKERISKPRPSPKVTETCSTCCASSGRPWRCSFHCS